MDQNLLLVTSFDLLMQQVPASKLNQLKPNTDLHDKLPDGIVVEGADWITGITDKTSTCSFTVTAASSVDLTI